MRVVDTCVFSLPNSDAGPGSCKLTWVRECSLDGKP